MRTIKLAGNGGITTLLEVCSTGYVTVIISGDKADFVFNSSDVFLSCTVPVYGLGPNEVLRIPKIHVQAAAKEGVLQIDTAGELLKLSVQSEDGKMFYTVSMKQQTAYTEQIDFMKEVAQGLTTGLKLDANKLVQLNRIANLVSGQINLDNGMASARFLNGRGFVWKPFVDDVSFSISCQTFKWLYKVDTVFYSYQNFVGAISDGLVIICKKRNVISNTELKYVQDNPSEFKSRFVADVSFRNLQKFLTEMKLKFDAVEIDLDSQSCCLDKDGQQFYVPIWVGESKAAPGTTGGKVSIPKEVIMQVLQVIQVPEFKLRIKKSFIQMDCKEFSLIF